VIRPNHEARPKRKQLFANLGWPLSRSCRSGGFKKSSQFSRGPELRDRIEFLGKPSGGAIAPVAKGIDGTVGVLLCTPASPLAR
jgi:hypothetical protein